MLIWNSFLLAFSALLPIINPFGSALIFVGLVGEAPSALYRSLARRIAINTIIFLFVIEVLGSALLRFFGVSLPIVQFAGGIVIAALAWRLLNEPDAEANTRKKKEEFDNRRGDPIAQRDALRLTHKAFYPFTFPVTAGPGTLVVMLTLSAHASEPILSHTIENHVGILLATILLSAIIYLSFAYAPAITQIIPASTAHGILRVIAFILFCIGVQIAWNGISALLKTIAHT